MEAPGRLQHLRPGTGRAVHTLHIDPRRLLGICHARRGDEMMPETISPRVYKLLKNIDLENVTNAQVTSVGDPISIEELNREECLRLIIVNVARLSVKQEWNGLLG